MSDWGLVEAFRELFQNALDNEIVNPENKMGWVYDEKEGKVTITNKTSKLSARTLLLGEGTKKDDNRTIGKHGEGYKIAFMVLLRNGKQITVYNYGANEVWEVKLVKSRKYEGAEVTTVFVEKEPFWSKVPNADLTIEVTGITPEEYETLVEKNLNLRKEVNSIKGSKRGELLLDEKEKGNIYVKGLYVSTKTGLRYGYNFEPDVISLDRDRKLVDSFEISWEASVLWHILLEDHPELEEKVVELVNENAEDVRYVSSAKRGFKIEKLVKDDFFEKNGKNAVPVRNNDEYELVKETGRKPVIVSENVASLVKSAVVNSDDETETIPVITLKDRFKAFMGKIESKLTDEELEEFQTLINKL